MSAKVDVRLAACKIIASILQGQSSLSGLIPRFQEQVDPKDHSLLQELCFGTCRQMLTLDYQLNQLMEKPLKAKDYDLKANLLCALYQIGHTRIPEYAVVDAAVENTKRLNKRWASKLCNGVLRAYLRQQKDLQTKVEQGADSIQLAHPNWLLKRWKKQWPEQWRELALANNQHPPMTLRINVQYCDRDVYLTLLKDADIPAHACNYSPVGIQLEKAVPVSALPHFADGWLSVQDEAAQLAAPLLNPQAGEHILDACCAPGGKTCHLLEYQNKLSVQALDSEARRLHRVEENLQRLQLNAELLCGDASDASEWWDGQHYDRILADVPCSATGVIRRHPDVKSLRKPEDITKLVELQQNILRQLWALLKPGGTLLYATCSVLQEENTQQIEAFLQEHEDAQEQIIETSSLGGVSPEASSWGQPQKFGRQLFPQEQGHDGFYYALLQKRA